MATPRLMVLVLLVLTTISWSASALPTPDQKSDQVTRLASDIRSKDNAKVYWALVGLADCGEAGVTPLQLATKDGRTWVRGAAWVKLAKIGKPALRVLPVAVKASTEPKIPLSSAIELDKLEFDMFTKIAALAGALHSMPPGSKPAGGVPLAENDAANEQWAIASAISVIGSHDSTQLLDLIAKDAGAFTSWQMPVRVRAFAAAVADNEKLLERELAGKETGRLRAAAYAVGWREKESERFVPALVKLLLHEQALVRAQALEALCAIHASWPALDEDLSRISTDASSRVRLHVASARLYCGNQPDYALAGFVALKRDTDREVARIAGLEISMLESTQGRTYRNWAPNGYTLDKAITSLIARLSDADPKTQQEAIRHLKLCGSAAKPALPELKRLSTAADAEVAQLAAGAVASIESAK